MSKGGGCLLLVNVQEWGCFSIFRRADDVTRTMSKGGGCLLLVNVQEWGCFSIFWRADDVTRTMSKGGVLVNVLCLHHPAPPLSGNPVSAPATYAITPDLCRPLGRSSSTSHDKHQHLIQKARLGLTTPAPHSRPSGHRPSGRA